jgi:hypothetical protein
MLVLDVALPVLDPRRTRISAGRPPAAKKSTVAILGKADRIRDGLHGRPGIADAGVA